MGLRLVNGILLVSLLFERLNNSECDRPSLNPFQFLVEYVLPLLLVGFKEKHKQCSLMDKAKYTKPFIFVIPYTYIFCR